MLDLRLKNARTEFPLKWKIEPRTAREFQVVSLPQKNGSFVASVVEAPEIIVYDRSRKVAEEKATKKFLSTPDPFAYRNHPLAKTTAVTIEMEYDEDAEAFVTFVKELKRMSTFGRTEGDALENTAEMIRGYIKSMEENRKKIPLAMTKLVELKRAVRFDKWVQNPSVSGKEAVRVLKKLGFRLERIEGSHHVMIKDGHPSVVVVPVHGSKPIPKGTLASIIRISGVGKQRFFASL